MCQIVKKKYIKEKTYLRDKNMNPEVRVNVALEAAACSDQVVLIHVGDPL